MNSVPKKVFDVRFAKSGRTIRVAEDDLVLSAALREGLTLPFYCRKGVCRSCRQVVTGERSGHTATLTPAERADGWDLLCVMRPKGDLVVEA